MRDLECNVLLYGGVDIRLGLILRRLRLLRRGFVLFFQLIRQLLRFFQFSDHLTERAALGKFGKILVVFRFRLG